MRPLSEIAGVSGRIRKSSPAHVSVRTSPALRVAAGIAIAVSTRHAVSAEPATFSECCFASALDRRVGEALWRRSGAAMTSTSARSPRFSGLTPTHPDAPGAGLCAWRGAVSGCARAAGAGESPTDAQCARSAVAEVRGDSAAARNAFGIPRIVAGCVVRYETAGRNRGNGQAGSQ